MSEILAQVIREAIAIRERELEELRQKLREAESNGGKKRKRTRKESGPRPGSIPALIADCLRDAGKALTSSDLSDRLAKKDKKVESRFVAAAISRYIKEGRIFSQTPEGLYTLRKDAA